MNFIICNKLQHRGTDFELLGREGSTAACKAVFHPSPPGSAIKKVVLRDTRTFHYDAKQASTSWLLCCAAFAIWGILSSFIQHHKAGIGMCTWPNAKNPKTIAKMQVVLLGSLKDAGVYTILFSLL